MWHTHQAIFPEHIALNSDISQNYISWITKDITLLFTNGGEWSRCYGLRKGLFLSTLPSILLPLPPSSLPPEPPIPNPHQHPTPSTKPRHCGNVLLRAIDQLCSPLAENPIPDGTFFWLSFLFLPLLSSNSETFSHHSCQSFHVFTPLQGRSAVQTSIKDLRDMESLLSQQ